MDVVYPVAGLVTVAAITPGPNNFAILQIAAQRGLRQTIPSIVGIVCGGLVMVLVCLLGLGAWIAADPVVARWIAGLGSAYLLWLAMRLVFPRFAAASGKQGESAGALPIGALRLFTFQFLNPKAWVLVLTATAAFQVTQSGIGDLAWLLVVFIFVPAACLLVWSLFGTLAARLLANASAARAFDRALGILLAASIVFLWR